MRSITPKSSFTCFSYAFSWEFQAGSFLVSSNSHLAEERELDDHVYSNDDYADTASLLEKVIVWFVKYRLV